MKKFMICFLFALSSTAFALPDLDRPVMVGGNSVLDACGGWGIATVTTLRYYQTQDGAAAWEVVPAGTGLTFCDEQEDYVGVVVPNFEGQACGVSSPIAERKEYDGPCKAGWIKRDFVEMLAGKKMKKEF